MTAAWEYGYHENNTLWEAIKATKKNMELFTAVL